MVYCIKAELAFSTNGRRDAITADVIARIAGKERFRTEFEVIEATTIKQGTSGIRIELRFISKLDAEDLMNRVINFATGQRLPLAGSWIEIHDCEHHVDGSCSNVIRQVW